VQKKLFVVWYVLAFSLVIPAHVPADDTAGSFLERGISFAEKEEYDTAIAEFDGALNLDPDLAAAYFHRGNAYGSKGDIDQAIADYTRAISIDPNYAAAYLSRGLAYSEKGDYDQALADSSQAISIDPNYAPAYVLQGVSYSEKGEYDWAIADYTQAIGIDPNYANAYKNRGEAYDKMGDHEKAEADYAQAARLAPNDAGFYYERGNGYYNEGGYDQAIADYTRAIELVPTLTYAYCNRGNAYAKKGDIDQAIADYTKAISIDPKYTLAYTNRGNVYYNKGDYDQATADYTRAIGIAPNDVNAKQGIERVRQAAGAGTPPERILSGGSISKENLVGFLLKNNQALEKRREWVNTLIDSYIAEAGREGVNYEIAFAQMCYHTNYLTFVKTLAKAETNNFCGINSLTSDKKAYTFESVQIGVRAHIQHLKGYASGEPLKGICVDPRYQYIGQKYGFGSAATIDGLSGKWAGVGYAKEIRGILKAMYN
jgi:tetratricopeptide (TPR) repeat protein